MTLEFVDNYLNAKLAQNREIIKTGNRGLGYMAYRIKTRR